MLYTCSQGHTQLRLLEGTFETDPSAHATCKSRGIDGSKQTSLARTCVSFVAHRRVASMLRSPAGSTY